MLRKSFQKKHQINAAHDSCAMAQFLALCSGNDFLAEIKNARVIKREIDKRVIIEGQFRGETVFCRFFLPEDAKVALREWDEIQRILPKMNTGELQVVRPLYVSEDGRILVLSKVEGEALRHCFVRALPGPFNIISEKVIPRIKHILNPQQVFDNKLYFQQAARWLRCYTADTEGWEPVQPEEHIRTVTGLFEKLPHGRFRKYQLDILRETSRIGKLLVNETWRTALSHGDLHSGNLIVNGQHMTGLDFNSSNRTPIYRDVARLLLNRPCRRTTSPSNRYLGVNRVCLDAFVTEFKMDEKERTLFLPFMIGCQSMIRVKARSSKRSHVRDDNRTYESLLDGLSQIG